MWSAHVALEALVCRMDAAELLPGLTCLKCIAVGSYAKWFPLWSSHVML